MDLTETIAPKSDQLNAEDLLTGPRTVTVEDVRRGSAEQPVEIVTAEFGPKRPFKPSKTVRRILVHAWGKDGQSYIGRRMTLFRDPDVKFGGMDVGGIRVSHMSHIDAPLVVALTVTRGKRAPHKVLPLVDGPARITAGEVRRLVAAMGDAGLTDRAEALAFLSESAGVQIGSSKELTPEQASKVFAALDARSVDAVQAELGAEEASS